MGFKKYIAAGVICAAAAVGVAKAEPGPYSLQWQYQIKSANPSTSSVSLEDLVVRVTDGTRTSTGVVYGDAKHVIMSWHGLFDLNHGIRHRGKVQTNSPIHTRLLGYSIFYEGDERAIDPNYVCFSREWDLAVVRLQESLSMPPSSFQLAKYQPRTRIVIRSFQGTREGDIDRYWSHKHVKNISTEEINTVWNVYATTANGIAGDSGGLATIVGTNSIVGLVVAGIIPDKNSNQGMSQKEKSSHVRNNLILTSAANIRRLIYYCDLSKHNLAK